MRRRPDARAGPRGQDVEMAGVGCVFSACHLDALLRHCQRMRSARRIRARSAGVGLNPYLSAGMACAAANRFALASLASARAVFETGLPWAVLSAGVRTNAKTTSDGGARTIGALAGAGPTCSCNTTPTGR